MERTFQASKFAPSAIPETGAVCVYRPALQHGCEDGFALPGQLPALLNVDFSYAENGLRLSIARELLARLKVSFWSRAIDDIEQPLLRVELLDESFLAFSIARSHCNDHGPYKPIGRNRQQSNPILRLEHEYLVWCRPGAKFCNRTYAATGMEQAVRFIGTQCKET